MTEAATSRVGIRTIGIVGGGAMGSGIAHVCAAAGFEVLVADADPAMRDKGVQLARELFSRKVKKGQLTEAEATSAAARVNPASGLEDLAVADLVIEAVTERLEVKLEVFRALDALLEPHAILASNTSALPVRDLASATGRPDRVLGLHFFNPAHVMALVEVIAHPGVSETTMAAGLELCRRLGKQPVKVRTDAAGFIVNRLLLSFLNEAVLMLEEHGQDAFEAIEVFVATRGFPMGPFTLADMVGVEVCVHVLRTLRAAFGASFPESRLLPEMVAAERYGQKKGKGFRVHGAPDDGWLAGKLAELGQPATSGPLGFDRLMLAMVAEAGRMLDETLAEPADIDHAMRLGTGMEQGPLAWADARGLAKVVAELEALASLGERFEVPICLRRAVETGRTGEKSPRFLPVTELKPAPARVKVTVDQGIAEVGLSQPPANVLSSPMLEDLANVLEELLGRPDVKAIVLTGRGRAGFFAAGADIREIGRLEDPEATRVLLSRAHAIFQRIWEAPVPIVAAINGWCLGGGLELALACHIRLASTSATLGLPETNLGIIPGFGGTQRLSRLIGSARALELVLTGRHVTAGEAAEIGLVNRVVPDEDLEEAARALASSMASKGRVALSAALDAVRQGAEQPLEQALQTETDQFVRTMDTHDRYLGISAFLRGDKEPCFVDR